MRGVKPIQRVPLMRMSVWKQRWWQPTKCMKFRKTHLCLFLTPGDRCPRQKSSLQIRLIFSLCVAFMDYFHASFYIAISTTLSALGRKSFKVAKWIYESKLLMFNLTVYYIIASLTIFFNYFCGHALLILLISCLPHSLCPSAQDFLSTPIPVLPVLLI